MKIIDSHCHCHYNNENYDWDLIAEKMLFLLNISTKGDDGKQWVINNFQLSQLNKKIFTYKNKLFLGYSVGYHPQDPNIIDYNYLKSITDGAIAIGEIGFDKGEFSPPISHQIINFHTQMKVAIENQIPVLIHCRDAWDIFFEAIDNYPNHPFVIHCFTGDKNIVEKLLSYNCLISISGVITYKNAEAIRESLNFIPLNKLLVETDSPFLTPFNYRKQGIKNNNPMLIDETINKISQIINIKPQDLIKIINENFLKFFQLNIDN
jgi:TatD DNase family protein